MEESHFLLGQPRVTCPESTPLVLTAIRMNFGSLPLACPTAQGSFSRPPWLSEREGSKAVLVGFAHAEQVMTKTGVGGDEVKQTFIVI